MTTIAWDGNILAADSQSSVGDTVNSLKSKKLYVNNFEDWIFHGHTIIAFASSGNAGDEFELIHRLKVKLGIDYDTKWTDSSNFMALLVTDRGECFQLVKPESKTNASYCIVEERATLGSGWQIAEAIMKAGHHAIEAVKIASEMNVYSGGNIQSFDYSSSLWNRIRNEEDDIPF
jgi:ATP-dependent protease HslVU (ClpYQ) peptidase subunit